MNRTTIRTLLFLFVITVSIFLSNKVDGLQPVVRRRRRISSYSPISVPSKWENGFVQNCNNYNYNNHCCTIHKQRSNGLPNISTAQQQQHHHYTTLRSLIRANDVWGNRATICGIAAVAQTFGQHTMIGKLLGPPVTAMAISFVAATIGILHPGGTKVTQSLQLLALQYATPLILLGADFRRDTLSRCGPLLLSFTAASLATIIACCCGWKIAGTSLTKSLGRDGLILAAALLAKNVGGGINYLAVCRTLNASPNAIAAGLCVDNLFALLYFPTTSILARGLPDVVESQTSVVKNDSAAIDKKQSNDIKNNHSVQNITIVVFLATLLLWLGEKLGQESGMLPACTLLTVLLVSCCNTSTTGRQWLPEMMTPKLQTTANELGLVCLYIFFATAGAPGMAVAESVRSSLLPLTMFLSCLYIFHGTILLLLRTMIGPIRLRGAFQTQRLLVSSSAAIGGPATAVALATDAQWKSLMIPSLLVGNIGYAVATFCGLIFHTYFGGR